jgi:hypothetical protein
LIGKVFFGLLILFWHQISVKLNIFLIKKLKALLNLREVCNVWLLVFTNIAFHDISNFNQALV